VIAYYDACRSAVIAYLKANPTLKDAVLAAMDRQRQQVRQQAGNQAVAQMGAGPGQPAATG
jgi:hypothetical protein